ncbi:hypothetical protein SISNIDRAFT_469786 [Sistotremastrum niveocremeum HHB9708]|uniref:DUF6535 domain-containing protein n=1 Tax=Sistotremastrum niveocremeum HHB9708 TaxID=1314777 RepID=A0A164PNB4_9AGAM|nr:hypothetical protein SISNIDRAFT_469786 [Sistotremastrum niveocremeum HHB9708]
MAAFEASLDRNFMKRRQQGMRKIKNPASPTCLSLVKIELANMVALDSDKDDENSQAHQAASSNYDEQDRSGLDTISLEKRHITRSLIVAETLRQRGSTELRTHTGDVPPIIMSSRSRRSRSPRFKRRQSIIREPAAAQDRPPDTISSSPSKFDQLLELVKTLNGLVGEQSKALNAQKEEIKAELRAQLDTMKKHSTMLQALETDATKDDKAYEGRKLRDAQTWNALDKETLAKIKVMVEEWREVMQISLVFIALFLTVVTAFISPVIQIFTTPPDSSSDSSSTKPPLPTVPTQLVALFYYLALITSISNSVLCVLGMQWGARLIATPLGKTNLERALARERRMLSAEGKMRSLMGVLVWTLLISIGFFVIGFLIQLWDLTFSFAGSAPILIIGGVLATGITLIILGIITVTTVHAGVNDNSPFESPLSNAMKPLFRWMLCRLQKCGHSQTEDNSDKDESEDESYKDEGIADKEDVAALIEWKKDDEPNLLALKTFAKLVLNTNDAEVLERVVPSFEYRQWHDAGSSLLPVFHAVHERFLATDTSFPDVPEGLGRLGKMARDWQKDLKANDFTQWCQEQCALLIESSNGSRRDFFPPFALFASLEEDNADLRQWASYSNEECVARILCTFDSDRELGVRGAIFRSAVYACDRLLWHGRIDDVTATLSHVDRASVLRSLIRNPHTWWGDIRGLVTFIVKGNEVEILDEMSDFFSNLPEMSVVPYDPDQPLLVCGFLEDIMHNSPSNFNSLFKRYSKTLIEYLDRGGLNNLSVLQPASMLWEYCRDVHNDPGTPLELLIITVLLALPGLSSEECEDLVRNVCALIDKTDQDNDDDNDDDDEDEDEDEDEDDEDENENDNDNDNDEDEDDDIRFSVRDIRSPILELLDLDEEQRNAVVARILSEIQRSALVAQLIQVPFSPETRIRDLVSYLTKDHELEILDAMSSSDTLCPESNQMSGLIDFLACLALSLPSDFSVPASFDLCHVIYHIAHHKLERQTWRKHGDTVMFYLDHGAFDKIGRDYLNDAAHFFSRCTYTSDRMISWDDAERTSEYTEERAIYYLGQLKARAAQDQDLADELSPYFLDGFEEPSLADTDEPSFSPKKAAWAFPFRKLRHAFGMAPRNTELLDTWSDIELGTPGGLCTDGDGVELL